MHLKVREVSAFLRRVRTRLPFKYGKAVVTGQPYVHLRVRFDHGGTGVAAAALPPAWFDKAPGRSHEDDIRDLLASVGAAASRYREAAPGSAHAVHLASAAPVHDLCSAHGLRGLTAHFGAALMDSALVDAACRASGRTFHQGLREGLFGTPPAWGALLPERPLSHIELRHTVGMADPIRPADPGPDPADGLPRSLEEVVRVHRPRWFKIKVSSDVAAMKERLRAIEEVLPAGARATLDGNEQFETAEHALAFVKVLQEDPVLRRLLDRCAWIEQPVHRDHALAAGEAEPLRKLAALKPVIIDESDDAPEAVDRALDLGYAGISAKNCKGPWRTLHSLERVRARGGVLSSEDLMNIPAVPLQQDLCVAAALGIPHSERNGHHYIRAFEHFSAAERDAALREFPSLYGGNPSGVRIVDGLLDVREVNAFGFGVRSEPDWDFLEPCPLPFSSAAGPRART